MSIVNTQIRKILESDPDVSLELDGYLSAKGWVDLRIEPAAERGLFEFWEYRADYPKGRCTALGRPITMARMATSHYSEGVTAFPPESPKF